MTNRPSFPEWQRSRGLVAAAARTEHAYLVAAVAPLTASIREMSRFLSERVIPVFVRAGEAVRAALAAMGEDVDA